MGKIKIPNGVDFPVDPKKGKKSTSDFGRKLLAAALDPIDKAAADKTRGEKNWRYGYQKHLLTLVKRGLRSPRNALESAKAGLAFVHENMVFKDGTGNEVSLKTADTLTTETYHTGVIKGEKGEESLSWGVTIENSSGGLETLEGEQVKNLCDEWVATGVIEPDAGAAITKFALMSPVERKKAVESTYFVLLGAGSAMGPFEVLMRMGVTVVACDLDMARIWSRLIKLTKNSVGTIVFPMKKKQEECKSEDEICENAGCNLITAPHSTAKWLSGLRDKPKMVIGAYCYLDGELFVRVSAAMDFIIDKVTKARASGMMNLPALAYLCTPTDAHMVTTDAYASAAAAYKKRAFWTYLFSPLLKPNKFVPVAPDDKNAEAICWQDATVVQQGPNYILAKRIQHWRAIVAREQGCVVSSNVAPSTKTVSVLHNKLIALAYKGYKFFRPLTAFHPSTSNCIMTALLVQDLIDPLSASYPTTKLQNPLELFARTAAHGGSQRMGFQYGSIGSTAAMMYVLTHPVAIIIYIALTSLIMKMAGYF